MDDLEYKDDQLQLERRWILFFLYTDGVTEAEKKDGSFYGDRKLIDNLDKYRDLAASELVNTIRADITNFLQPIGRKADDITMLAIRYLASKQKMRTDAYI